jgi:NADH-quinone oxidoreductase subunit G
MGLGLIGGKALDSALQAAQTSPVDALIILENDLDRRMSQDQINKLFRAARHVILLECLETPTAKQAEFVLPAATFAEASGTLVNNEGRAQRFYQVFVPGDDTQESWHWLKDILDALGRPEGSSWSNLDNLQAAMAEALPVLKPVLEISPPASFRMTGEKIPRQPSRWSGRTSIYANISVHEPKPPDDPNSPLAFTMEGAKQQPPQQPPSALIPRFWSPGWNSIQALNKFQSEIAGPLRGGNPGCRLIEPADSTSQTNYFLEIPQAFQPRPADWLVVPLYYIYGSEELSMLTPGIAGQAPQPYLAMNPADVAAIKGTVLETGKLDPALETGLFELTLDETTLQLPLRIDNNLPRGLIGMPSGLPGLRASVLPAWGKLSSVPPAEKGAGIK